MPHRDGNLPIAMCDSTHLDRIVHLRCEFELSSAVAELKCNMGVVTERHNEKMKMIQFDLYRWKCKMPFH